MSVTGAPKRPHLVVALVRQPKKVSPESFEWLLLEEGNQVAMIRMHDAAVVAHEEIVKSPRIVGLIKSVHLRDTLAATLAGHEDDAARDDEDEDDAILRHHDRQMSILVMNWIHDDVMMKEKKRMQNESHVK